MDVHRRSNLRWGTFATIPTQKLPSFAPHFRSTASGAHLTYPYSYITFNHTFTSSFFFELSSSSQYSGLAPFIARIEPVGIFGVHRKCRCVEPKGEKKMATGNIIFRILVYWYLILMNLVKFLCGWHRTQWHFHCTLKRVDIFPEPGFLFGVHRKCRCL